MAGVDAFDPTSPSVEAVGVDLTGNSDCSDLTFFPNIIFLFGRTI